MSVKSMPYSIEAEESLLGNIMLYPDAIREVSDANITPDDFYLEKHVAIYNMMVNMFERKETIDAVHNNLKISISLLS